MACGLVGAFTLRFLHRLFPEAPRVQYLVSGSADSHRTLLKEVDTLRRPVLEGGHDVSDCRNYIRAIRARAYCVAVRDGWSSRCDSPRGKNHHHGKTADDS